MKKYTIYMGLNDKDSKMPRATMAEAREWLKGYLAGRGVGATITDGVGVYRHDDGTVVMEESAIITVYDFDGCFKSQATEIFGEIKNEFNQESLAVEISDAESILV